MLRYVLGAVAALCLAAPAEATETITISSGTATTGNIYGCCLLTPTLTAFTLVGATPLSRIANGNPYQVFGYADADGNFTFSGSASLLSDYYGAFYAPIRAYVGDSWTHASFGTITSFTVSGLAGAPPVPEPPTWAMLLLGFGLLGAAIRRSRSKDLSPASSLHFRSPHPQSSEYSVP